MTKRYDEKNICFIRFFPRLPKTPRFRHHRTTGRAVGVLCGAFCSRLLLCLVLWSAGISAELLKGAQAQEQGKEIEIEYPFHNAIRLQDFAEALRLLGTRGFAQLTQEDEFGMLPLHIASSLGSMEAIGFLVGQGIDVRYIPPGGYSALVRGRAPLHLAVGTGNTQVIDRLVQAGVDVYAQDKGGVTPLHLAVKYGRIRAATRLIEIAGERAHQRDKNGTTPLHLAARHGRDIIVTKLLFLGDKEKATLSKRLQKLLESEKGLLWRAELVNAQNNFGLAPLHYAALGGHTEVIELLLEQGAKINITNDQGRTPLFMAARNGREKVVDILSKRSGIELERGDNNALTPLAAAVLNGHSRILARLLQRGADPRVKNKNGMAPLHLASKRGEVKTIVVLLKALNDNANIDEHDKSGNTPLHYATQTGKKNVVMELLKAGADSSLRNNDNKTARDIAQELGHNEVLAVLR